MKKLSILCVIAAVLIIGANALAPSVVEQGLYYALSDNMEIQPADVQVTAQPGLKVLSGNLDSVRVHSQKFKVKDMTFDSLDCSLQQTRFSLLSGGRVGHMVLTDADSGELTATVRSEELEKFLVRKIEKLSDPTVSLENDQVHVTGTVAVGGFLKAKADLRGTFAMKGSKLMFIPSSMTIDGMGKTFSNTSTAGIEVYDFKDFPLGIQPDSVTMRDHVLTIYGSIHHT
jgi:hypothetical protein